MSDPVLFLLSVVTLLCMPGPTNTLLATSAAVAGVRRSLPLLAGELAGYLSAIIVIRVALEPFIKTDAVQICFKILIALYLAFTAVRLWNASITAALSIVRTRGIFAATLLNPKAFVFAIVVIPHDVIRVAPYFMAFSACVLTTGFLWLVLGHIAGGRFHSLVPRIASVVLGGFASLILVRIVG
jgi:threonine/homoserine/homoserine lactone efflux protein